MKSINIYHRDYDQDVLVAHIYNIGKMDITPSNDGYIEFVEHYPAGNQNHDMWEEPVKVVYLYPEESMRIVKGIPAFLNNHKYYKLPEECYEIYKGKEQKSKTLKELNKEDTQ